MDGVKVTIHAQHTIRSCGFAGHPPECPGYGSGEHAERIIEATLGRSLLEFAEDAREGSRKEAPLADLAGWAPGEVTGVYGK